MSRSTSAAASAASGQGTAAAGAAPAVGRLEADPGVRFAFTGRADGNVSRLVGLQDDVDAARERLAALIGLEGVDTVYMEQVHGSGVAVVGLSDRARGLTRAEDAVPGVDALVTTDPDVGLAVLVADCVPVVLAVPRRGVAAVHAGRQGILGGVVGAAVAVLTERTGAAPGEVVAVLGPAVGGCCYEVPRELQLEVVMRIGAAGATTSWGTPSLDLPAAVAEQLRAAGVSDIEPSGACTVCDPATWFSHRATANAGAPEGRQAGAVRVGGRSASGASAGSGAVRVGGRSASGASAGPGAVRMGAAPPRSGPGSSLDSP